MQVDDIDSWSYDSNADGHGFTSSFGPGIPGYVWNYGKEVPCNLLGQYVHLVAYLDHLIPTYGSYEMSICNYGIMGTFFERDELLPVSIEVYQGEIATLTIPHITSGIEIGTKLAIDIRYANGAELPFVTFESGTSSTKVQINAENVDLGDYQLVVESFNTLSSV